MWHTTHLDTLRPGPGHPTHGRKRGSVDGHHTRPRSRHYQLDTQRNTPGRRHRQHLPVRHHRQPAPAGGQSISLLVATGPTFMTTTTAPTQPTNRPMTNQVRHNPINSGTPLSDPQPRITARRTICALNQGDLFHKDQKCIP